MTACCWWATCASTRPSTPADPISNCRKRECDTARLDEIVRQKDPALKEAVEQLARGEVREAIDRLDGQGRVHEIADRARALAEIAREYAAQPEGTLVVSPDNQSRRELNGDPSANCRSAAWWATEEHAVKVLHAAAGPDRRGPRMGRAI